MISGRNVLLFPQKYKPFKVRSTQAMFVRPLTTSTRRHTDADAAALRVRINIKFTNKIPLVTSICFKHGTALFISYEKLLFSFFCLLLLRKELGSIFYIQFEYHLLKTNCYASLQAYRLGFFAKDEGQKHVLQAPIVKVGWLV